MYNNPYYYSNNFNQQSINDRIDNQIQQLQQMKEQMKNNNQPTSINQTFQLAPTNQSGIRYANTIEDVSKEMVFGDTPFFSKDMSVMWLKNNKGDIKSYELKEIKPLDSKDIQIEYLQSQIEELRKEMNTINEQSNTNVISTKNEPNTEEFDEPIREPVENVKPTSIQRVSTSKKK